MKGRKHAKISVIILLTAIAVMVSGLMTVSLAASTKKVTAYTYQPYTFVNVKPDSSSTSPKYPIPYKAKVTVYGDVKIDKSFTKNKWVKIKYKDKIYYTYVKKGTKAFTKTKLGYKKFNNITTPIKQKVVNNAINILRNKKTMYSHATPGSLSNGKMQFDCSGFVAYVTEGVLKTYVKNLNIPNNIDKLYAMNWIYTDANGKVSAKTICTGKPDFSKLKPGDIVFFKEDSSCKKACDHAGIYIGKKEFINSTKFTNGVSIMPLDHGKYKKRFVCAKRILPDAAPKPINKVVTLKSGASVYPVTDLKFKNKQDNLKTGDTVTVLYETPLSWTSSYHCVYVRYKINGTTKTGFMSSSKVN